tara:strand:+ start:145 stop:501 length:357 start_codon:yes stop_codon:yes gene_type:complete
METVKSIGTTGFRQFTKSEAVAVIDAKTSKLSENFERELRDLQEKMHTTVREIVRDQLDLLTKRIERNTNDIRTLMDRKRDRDFEERVEAMTKKNAENIKVIDDNIKTLDKNLQNLSS